MQKDHRMTRKLDSLSGGRAVRPVIVVVCSAAIATVGGCSRVPSFNILGSFFPAWILCGVIGILLAVVVRLYFVRIKLE